MGEAGKIRLKIETFFESYPLKKFDKNQTLVQAGENPGGVIHLLEGQVQQYDISPAGDKVIVNIFKPPAFFPMNWAINKTPNEYFFEAATDASVRIAPVSEVIKFLKNNPDVTLDLLARVYSGVDGVLRRMAHLMGGNAKTRVVYELINESKRFGQLKPDGSLVLKLTEGQLASRSGLTRETVSRHFNLLTKEGLIVTKRQQLIIPDLKKLENYLGTAL